MLCFIENNTLIIHFSQGSLSFFEKRKPSHGFATLKTLPFLDYREFYKIIIILHFLVCIAKVKVVLFEANFMRKFSEITKFKLKSK